MTLLERLRRLFALASPGGRGAAPRDEAIDANERGNRAADAGDDAEAERCYREAARLDARWAVPWFNLGLAHKHARRWRESFEANRRALELEPAKAEAAWNLGIAATALSDWVEARRAWRAYGLEIPDGDGPLELDLGPVPIRVGGDEAPEVVWCVRLDPARARVASVPFPESGRRHGDLLLHDGAPKGYRKLGDREVPVFEELELLAPSAESTWTVEVDVPGPDDAAALAAAFERRGLLAEDWTLQVRLLCKACSEGRPHEPGESHGDPGDPAAPWKRRHLVGIAAEREEPVCEVLAEWSAGGAGRAHEPPSLALPGDGRGG